MRQVLDWIKANPIILASLVITLLSVGGLVYVVGGGNAFVKQLSGRINEVNNIKKYEQTSLEWPHADPDHAPMRATAAVNPQTIKILETIYGKIKVEYKDIFEYAVSKNQANHQLIDPQLFPANDSTHQRRCRGHTSGRHVPSAPTATGRHTRMLPGRE